MNTYLRLERQNHQLSLRQLSEVIQKRYNFFVSKSTLSYIEQPGKNIDARLLFILIDYYQLNFKEVQQIIMPN